MVKLFIEGTTDTTNANLREGFSKLFEQKLKGKMPKIILGNDQKTTAKKFLNEKEENKFLLVDLDKTESGRDEVMAELRLNECKNNTFFMIQEMEAWILSQPGVLDEYYGENISDKIPKKHCKEIVNPSDELMKYTKHTKKGKYHKVKDGVNLLQKLDLTKLEEDFDDVKRLIKALK